MSAIHQTFPARAAFAAPRLRLRLPLPALAPRRAVRPRRSLAEIAAPVLILILLVLAGLIWVAVGGAVMRGTR
jgi:hypothetical protein